MNRISICIGRFVAVALALGIAMPVFANSSATQETSSDRTKNPITGTVTDTKKYKKRHTNEDGSQTNVDVTEKVKTKSDGSREATTDSDVSTEPAKK